MADPAFVKDTSIITNMAGTDGLTYGVTLSRVKGTMESQRHGESQKQPVSVRIPYIRAHLCAMLSGCHITSANSVITLNSEEPIDSGAGLC